MALAPEEDTRLEPGTEVSVDEDEDGSSETTIRTSCNDVIRVYKFAVGGSIVVGDMIIPIMRADARALIEALEPLTKARQLFHGVS